MNIHRRRGHIHVSVRLCDNKQAELTLHFILKSVHCLWSITFASLCSAFTLEANCFQLVFVDIMAMEVSGENYEGLLKEMETLKGRLEDERLKLNDVACKHSEKNNFSIKKT